MKKILSMMVALVMAASMSAQTNYAGSSKFTDNWNISLQGGVVTSFDNFFDGHTACTPIVVLGLDKYVNPWLGFGLDARTAIGTGTVGHAHNPHTAFDAVNLSGLLKVNLANLLVGYKGHRYLFEPVAYTGLGWGHTNCSLSDGGDAAHYDHVYDARNYMTYRAGMEFNFNLGEKRAWAIVVNPSVVWGNICNGNLKQARGNFEVTAGLVYHFKTSNGTHAFASADIAGLNARIAALEAENAALRNRPAEVKEVVKKEVVTNAVEKTYVVLFELDSAELSEQATSILNGVAKGTTVAIDAYASPEGKSDYNQALSQRRADAVKAYLEGRGVKVVETNAHGAENKFSNRVAIVTVK